MMLQTIGIVVVPLLLCLSFAEGQESITVHEDQFWDYPPPRLHPLEDEHVVEAQQNWSLMCSGKFPIEWVLPSTNIPDGDPNMLDRVTITHEIIPGDNPRPHVSFLEIRDLSFLDTGRYYCRYNGTTDNEVLPNVTSTYLFATDPVELLDSKYKINWVNVYQYKETRIRSCCPTHPDVKMTFSKEGDITDSLQKMLFRFEPKEGLIIIDGTTTFHSGLVSCTGTLNGSEMTVSNILRIREVPRILPIPYIVDPYTKGYPILGSQLTLTCGVNVDYNSIHLELEWGFPDPRHAKEAIQSGRIKISKQQQVTDKEGLLQDSNYVYINNAESMKYYTKEITINPLEKSDLGIYTCYSVLGPNRSENHTFHLYRVIGNESDPIIAEPEFQGDPSISVDSKTHGKKPVQWIFKMFANPDPSYIWLNPQGRSISYEQLEKYVIDADQKTGNIKLVINDVDLTDTGRYVFHVEVKGGDGKIVQKDVDLFLKYNRDPRVTLTSDQEPQGDLFITGRQYPLTCVASGFPMNLKTLKWTFKPCKSFNTCSDNELIQIKPDYVIQNDDNLDDDFHYRYKSGVNATSDKSGVYTCEICRKFDPSNDSAKTNCNSSSMNFFVGEYLEGFSINGPVNPRSIIEGDTFDVTCGVSIYKYRKAVWFKKDLSQIGGGELWKLVEHIPEIKLSSNESEFSVASTMSFSSITIADDGIYQCRAVHLTSASEVSLKDYRIQVIPPVAPHRSTTNNINNNETSVKIATELYLDCSSEGRPTPEIKWFKDGEQITKTFLANSSSLEMSSDGAVLHIVYALPQHSGKYECQTSNRAGASTYTVDLNVESPSASHTGMIAGIVAGIVIVLILICLLTWKVRAYEQKYKELTKNEVDRFMEGDPKAINSDLGVDEQAELLPYDAKYEFPRENLKLGKQIGSGAFGRVLKAEALGIVPWEPSSVVAVKMLQQKLLKDGNHDYFKSFLAELKIMIHLGKHINILNVLGACTTQLRKRDLLVIVEYCRFGNIQKYLICHRPSYVNQLDKDTGEVNFSIDANDILSFSGRKGVERLPSSASGRRSVRYTTQPGSRRHESVQSDYLEDNQITVTGMTMLSPDETDTTDQIINTNSIEEGQGWMANLAGEYDHRASLRPLHTKDIIYWAYQITRGMDYVTSKKVMHGDLACRNILLASNNIIKISDFGLSKDMYKSNMYQKKSKTPLPVKWLAIESLNDRIFSTQSDVWSFGIVLWEMFSLGRTPYPGINDPNLLYDKISSGYRMAKPDYCPQNIYEIMRNCWEETPSRRPSFAQMERLFCGFLEESDRAAYNEQCQTFNDNIQKLRGNTAVKFQQPSSIENKDYLSMMASPSYNAQISVRPGSSQEQLALGDCGYISPNPATGSAPSLGMDGYLLPNLQTSIAIDNQGYLIASPISTKSPDNIELKSFEEWPILNEKDNGNLVTALN